MAGAARRCSIPTRERSAAVRARSREVWCCELETKRQFSTMAGWSRQFNRVKEMHMSKTIAAAIATALAFGATVGAQDASAKGVKEGGHAVLTPAAEVKWADVPGFPGVQMAVLGGNPGKGPHHSMLKFAGGFSAPVHHHSSDHYGTVVSGTLVLVVDGKDNKLPSGSYFAFTGKAKHATRCEAGADCVVAIDARGKWDVVPADAKK
jgi:quercetin dioxygenase-like cupin family protein